MPGDSFITVVGHLGRAPELRATPQGNSVCTFSIGVSQRKDAPTIWYRAEIWGRSGEMANQYLTKGSLVQVRGEFLPNEYDKRDGGKGMSFDIKNANWLKLSRDEAQPSVDTTPAGEVDDVAAAAVANSLDTDIPF